MQFYEFIVKQRKESKSEKDDSIVKVDIISKLIFQYENESKILNLDFEKEKIRMSKIGTLFFVTALGNPSKIGMYSVIKNIEGIDRMFIIFSNTSFKECEEIMTNGMQLSEKQKKQ